MTPVQATAPAALATKNLRYGIFDTPASGPARMRSTATKRPMNTILSPWRMKYLSAFASFSGVIPAYLPYLSRKRLPPLRPTTYPTESPITAPEVAAPTCVYLLITWPG